MADRTLAGAASPSPLRAHQLVEHDALTGLPNRACLRQQLRPVLAAAGRRGGQVGVFFIDLDHFRVVNETLGHEVGDRVLMEVARRLMKTLSIHDLLGRFAGDEYVAAVRGDVCDAALIAVAGEMLRSLSEPYRFGGEEFILTPSIGIGVYPRDGEDLDSLLSTAETAMRSAKANGRANFKFFRPAMAPAIPNQLEIASAVRRGLARGEFRLFYQPQIDAARGRMAGAEALVRWDNAERGWVAPGSFIPVIEGTRLMVELGEWVLAEAARHRYAWCQQGRDVRISVNVSPLQFSQEDFAEVLERVGRTWPFAAGAIQLEVTESLMIDQADIAIARMRKVRELGFALSLDDFGTGYSSLAYLTRFPLDELKIDQSFVRRVASDPTTRSIVEAIIRLAHALGMRVVAEGVETASVASALQRLGCNEYQGYHYAKPMPASAFERWLAAQDATPSVPGTHR